MTRFFLVLLIIQIGMGVGFSAEPGEGREDAVRFFPVEVWGDSGENRLAAYQIVLAAESSEVLITSIEGGAHPAFREPPTYDPRAIQGNRLIAAQFSLKPARELPAGSTRLFTVHIEAPAGMEPQFTVRVMAAGGPDGRRIPLRCRLALPTALPDGVGE